MGAGEARVNAVIVGIRDSETVPQWGLFELQKVCRLIPQKYICAAFDVLFKCNVFYMYYKINLKFDHKMS